MTTRFCFVDLEGDYYLIPVDKLFEWKDVLENEEMDLPEWAENICPTEISFDSVEYGIPRP